MLTSYHSLIITKHSATNLILKPFHFQIWASSGLEKHPANLTSKLHYRANAADVKPTKGKSVARIKDNKLCLSSAAPLVHGNIWKSHYRHGVLAVVLRYNPIALSLPVGGPITHFVVVNKTSCPRDLDPGEGGGTKRAVLELTTTKGWLRWKFLMIWMLIFHFFS